MARPGLSHKQRAELRQAAARSVMDGQSFNQVMASFDVSRSMLTRGLAEIGAVDWQYKVTDHVTPESAKVTAEIVRLRSLGYSVQDIASEVGLSVAATKTRLCRSGLRTDAHKNHVKLKDVILNLYDAGLCQVEIARIISKHPEVVARVLVKAGVDTERNKNASASLKKRTLTDEQEREIVEKYKAGKSQRFLSFEYDMSRTGIESLLHRHGIKGLRPVGRRKAVREAK